LAIRQNMRGRRFACALPQQPRCRRAHDYFPMRRDMIRVGMADEHPVGTGLGLMRIEPQSQFGQPHRASLEANVQGRHKLNLNVCTAEFNLLWIFAEPSAYIQVWQKKV